MPTKSRTIPAFPKKDIDANKYVASLSYLWILFLIPLLMKKDSAFAQEHAKQGLVLFLASIANAIIGLVPILGWMVSFFGWFILLGVSIFGFLKALGGEFWEVPVLGEYRDRFNL